MKTILHLSLALLFLASCQGKKEKLQLNLVKGQTYTQRLISNMTITQNISGQQMNMTMAVGGKMVFKVVNSNDSIFDIDVRYESLSMKMGMPNGTMEFSSDKQDEKDVFSTVLGSMRNKSFMVRMDKYGKVKEVKNIDTLFSGFFEKFPQISNEQKQVISDQIKQAYGTKTFKGNLEMTSAIFPEHPVAIGDPWVTKTTMTMSGADVNLESNYKLKEVHPDYYLISGSSKLVTDNKGKFVQTNGMPVKYEMTGTMTTEIKVDRKTGWIIDSKTSQALNGAMEIKDNPKVPGGMFIPMMINNEMELTDK